ncbi:MAG: MBL fold metallo-hydrolase [Methanobacteriota archaeon]
MTFRPSRRDRSGRFRNLEPTGGPRGFKDFLRWRYGRPPEPSPPGRRRFGSYATARRVPFRREALAGEGPNVAWLGHSTFLVKLGADLFLTDPMLGRAAGPFGIGVPRLVPPPVSPEALPRLSGLLVSHDHYDHLDGPTVRGLPRDTPVFCPLEVGRWFRSRGFKDVRELDWGERAELPGAEVAFVPAQHFSGRTPWNRDRTLWGGYLVESHGTTLYYAGDSGSASFFKDVGREAEVDVAILPIGAYEPRWFMSAVHMSPEEAGRAFEEVGARSMVPCHWGTFRLAEEPMEEPPQRLGAWWRSRGLDPERLRIPAVGETLPFP